MYATVYGAPARDYPSGVKQDVEILRFITGYRTGLEVLVDVSPYSPLLDAVSRSSEVEAFAHIDTYVGRSTGYKTEEHLAMYGGSGYGNSTLGEPCRLQREVRRDSFWGSGWGLTAELLLWRKQEGAPDTRPRETITLATGAWGGTYWVGNIRYYQGWSINNGAAVLLDDPVDFSDKQDGQVSVYECPTGGIPMARRLYGWFNQAIREASRGTWALNSLLEKIRDQLHEEQMASVNVLHVLDQTNLLVCENNPDLSIEPSMLVYVKDGEVDSNFLRQGRQRQAIGQVVKVEDGRFHVRLDIDCIPNAATGGRPHLVVPKSPAYMQEVATIIDALQNAVVNLGHKSSLLDIKGQRVFKSEDARPEHYQSFSPNFMAVKGRSLEPLLPVAMLLPGEAPTGGRMSLIQTSASGSKTRQRSGATLHNATDGAGSFLQSGSGRGRRLCLVDEESTGVMFERRFDMPVKEAGDRTVLQFVSTGHGWASTQFHCGEFCHSIYRLTFNRRTTLDIALWRDDCIDNPWGPAEYGTWNFSRNGWCPGSVEPGLYVDVTDHLHEGQNELQVEMLVLNNETLVYETFLDAEGYLTGDSASVVIGLTLSIYPGSAYEAIKQQDRAFTAAERALRDGSSAYQPEMQSQEFQLQAASSLFQSSNSSDSLLRNANDRDKALHLVKHLALRQGIRTPMGVMVAHPERRHKRGAGGPPRDALLEVDGTPLRRPPIEGVFKQHKVQISHGQFNALLQKAESGWDDSHRSSSASAASSQLEVDSSSKARPVAGHYDAVHSHKAQEGAAVTYGSISPGDELLLGGLIVQALKSFKQYVKVRFPDGVTQDVGYEGLRHVRRKQVGREGTCDQHCDSGEPLLGDGSCRQLVQQFAKLQKVDLSMKQTLAAVNKLCSDQCVCTMSDYSDASYEADYSDGCQKLVTPVVARQTCQNSTGEPMREQVIDYESAAPWYCYSTEQERQAGRQLRGPDIHRVKIFDHTNVHGGARTVTTKIKDWNLPDGFQWGRASLHFRLDKPRWPGRDENGRSYLEEFDFWDRFGTLGFHLPGDGSRLSLFPGDDHRQRQWPIVSEERQGMFKIGSAKNVKLRSRLKHKPVVQQADRVVAQYLIDPEHGVS